MTYQWSIRYACPQHARVHAANSCEHVFFRLVIRSCLTQCLTLERSECPFAATTTLDIRSIDPNTGNGSTEFQRVRFGGLRTIVVWLIDRDLSGHFGPLVSCLVLTLSSWALAFGSASASHSQARLLSWLCLSRRSWYHVCALTCDDNGNACASCVARRQSVKRVPTRFVSTTKAVPRAIAAGPWVTLK